MTNPAHIPIVVPKYYRPTSSPTPTMVRKTKLCLDSAFDSIPL